MAGITGRYHHDHSLPHLNKWQLQSSRNFSKKNFMKYLISITKHQEILEYSTFKILKMPPELEIENKSLLFISL
jgi:hypothetical protein